MYGYIVEYKPNDARCRVDLNHALFGRLIYRKYKAKNYAYYNPGILDSVKFFRLAPGKVFVEKKINVEYLNLLGTISQVHTERDEKQMLLITGREHWKNIATEKKLVFKINFKNILDFSDVVGD